MQLAGTARPPSDAGHKSSRIAIACQLTDAAELVDLVVRGRTDGQNATLDVMRV